MRAYRGWKKANKIEDESLSKAEVDEVGAFLDERPPWAAVTMGEA